MSLCAIALLVERKETTKLNYTLDPLARARALPLPSFISFHTLPSEFLSLRLVSNPLSARTKATKSTVPRRRRCWASSVSALKHCDNPYLTLRRMNNGGREALSRSALLMTILCFLYPVALDRTKEESLGDLFEQLLELEQVQQQGR